MLRHGTCRDARSSAMMSATIPSIRSQLFFLDVAVEDAKITDEQLNHPPVDW
jgi:hypothetical protein